MHVAGRDPYCRKAVKHIIIIRYGKPPKAIDSESKKNCDPFSRGTAITVSDFSNDSFSNKRLDGSDTDYGFSIGSEDSSGWVLRVGVFKEWIWIAEQRNRISALKKIDRSIESTSTK
jgi:hypothetical protein